MCSLFRNHPSPLISHVNHSGWRLYRPTSEADVVRFRSLIYVNRRVSTSSHWQLRCDHTDITAVKIWSADSQILLYSVYIPCIPLRTPNQASAEAALTATKTRSQLPNRTTDVPRVSFSRVISTATIRPRMATTSSPGLLKM